MDLSYLEELPEGTYYLMIVVIERGEYIESESQHENEGYECAFKLVVKQQ
jgi:hypothetical protein